MSLYKTIFHESIILSIDFIFTCAFTRLFLFCFSLFTYLFMTIFLKSNHQQAVVMYESVTLPPHRCWHHGWKLRLSLKEKSWVRLAVVIFKSQSNVLVGEKNKGVCVCLCVLLLSPCWLGSGSSWFFLTERSSGPSWSAMRSLLRTGFCAEAAAVPPPPPLLAPVPLLQAAAPAEVGLRPGPGVGDGEEEADDGGELGAGRGPGGELGARDATLGRLWSFMMPLGRGESSWVVFEVYSAANWRIIRCMISRATRGMWGSEKVGRSAEKQNAETNVSASRPPGIWSVIAVFASLFISFHPENVILMLCWNNPKITR